MTHSWIGYALWSLALVGCVENDQSFVILQNQAVLAPECRAASEGVALPRGAFDLALASLFPASRYFVYPVVRNNLTSLMMGSIQLSNISLTGFEFVLHPEPKTTIASVIPRSMQDDDHPTVLMMFAGYLAPGASYPMAIPVVSHKFVEDLDTQGRSLTASTETLTVRFRVLGERGGTGIASNWVSYPIDVCHSCLLNPGPAIPPCSEFKGKPRLGGCGYWQDQQVSCCYNGPSLFCGSEIEEVVIEDMVPSAPVDAAVP